MAVQQNTQFSSRDGSQELLVIADTLKLLHLHPVATTFAVLAAYALLLMISTNYIQIAAIPAIILVFIGVLWGNFWVKGRLEHRNSGTAANQGSGSGQAWRMLLPTVLLSYCLQLIQLACAQVTNEQQQSDNFLFSHSLLFLSSALGALAVMIAALPIRANQCVAQGQQLIHRTFIVVFMIAVHMMATEWMVEVMLLVCMPEFIASLVWFTGNFHHARCMLLIDKVTSRKSTLTFLTAAVALLAFMFAFEKEMLLANYYWYYTRILYPCTLSGLLSCLCVCMILQWRPDISANVPLDWPSDSAIVSIRILEFSAVICFAMSAMLLFIGFLLNYSILL